MHRQHSRARSETSRLGEAGVTVLEMVMTMTLVTAALIALIAALDNATKTTSFSQKRNEALDDLRFMASVFGKDVRQGVRATTVSPTAFAFSTYIDGEVHDVEWRAVTGADDDRLERVVDGGVANVYLVDLTTTSVFSYFEETDPSQVNRVRLSLATQLDDRFSPVGLSTEVEMRNVG